MIVKPEYYGETIVSAILEDDRLRLSLGSGKTIEIWDAGQSCCEYRHMTTDDDVTSIVGKKLVGITEKEGPEEEEDEYGGYHETCFVEVTVDDGFITLVTHNEHNGYYGGFDLAVTEV